MSATSRTPLDYALAYARRGWRVFPLHEISSGDCSCGRDACASAGKHPRTKNGVKEATTDEAQIRAWWSYWPTANIGIATGIAQGATSGLFVIDVDTHKGATLADLEGCDLSVLLTSLTARTGNGGYHFYLSTDERLSNTCDHLARFVDTRGEGGYVVAPPSRNRQGAYRWENNLPIQPVPGAVLITLNFMRIVTRHRAEQEEKQRALLSDPPMPVAREAQTTAAQAAPPLSEARNNYLTSVAGRLRGSGLTADEICALLTTLNEKRYGAGRHVQGPLTLEELERTIFKSVARWEMASGVHENRLPVVTALADLMGRQLPEPNWLVPGLLCEGLVLFAGKPKLGKSWLALSLALACASTDGQQGGQAFGHYSVRQGGVLYLSLEDSEKRFQSRVRKLLGGRPVPSGFGYALEWKPLLSGGLADLETILSNAPDTRLLVIDTLARVRAHGGSNGSNGSSGYQEDYALMAALHMLVVRYHLTLILVHHTRKLSSDDTFDEISGTLGLTGAADTSMVLKRPRGEGDATLHLTGRDVEEQELALTFDPATCAWTVTGKAADRQRIKASDAVVSVLTDLGPCRQRIIEQEVGMAHGTVSTILSRLMREKIVLKEGRGLYMLASHKETQDAERTAKEVNKEKKKKQKDDQEPSLEKTHQPEQPLPEERRPTEEPADLDDAIPDEEYGWPEFDDEFGYDPDYDEDDSDNA